MLEVLECGVSTYTTLLTFLTNSFVLRIYSRTRIVFFSNYHGLDTNSSNASFVFGGSFEYMWFTYTTAQGIFHYTQEDDLTKDKIGSRLTKNYKFHHSHILFIKKYFYQPFYLGCSRGGAP